MILVKPCGFSHLCPCAFLGGPDGGTQVPPVIVREHPVLQPVRATAPPCERRWLFQRNRPGT
jgi:hypothetical protein